MPSTTAIESLRLARLALDECFRAVNQHEVFALAGLAVERERMFVIATSNFEAWLMHRADAFDAMGRSRDE